MNLFKKIAAMIFVFAFATTAFAVTPNQSTSVATLKVKNMNGSNTNWGSSTSISEGQILYVQLHYFIEKNGQSANDMRFKVENLDGRSFSAGQVENVSGFVSADNMSTAHGSGSVSFQDDVTLEFDKVWWEIWPCTATSCATGLVDSARNVLNSNGMTIGNVSSADATNNGNVIVQFRAVANNPTYDDCSVNGITVAHGSSKTFYSNTSVPYGNSCSAIDQVRSCNDGTLSGSNTYKYASCSVGEPGDDDADVTTVSATSIDEDSATLNGDLDLNDWDDAEVYFIWGTSSSNLNNTTSDSLKSSDGTFSKGISGLDDDQTYYYRAVAENPDNGEKEYGVIKSFRTDDEGGSSNNDDVTTNSASSVDEDSARLNGEWEGDDNIEVWFAFDEDDTTPSCNDSSQREGVQIVDDGEDFSKIVSGLDENEKYYFRACAEDTDGDIISGSIKSFTTDEEGDDDDDDDDNVDVTTNSATSIDEDSARLNGEVEGDDNVSVWFAFSRTDTTPSCNISSQKVSVSGSYDDGDDFSKVVSGLADNTKYYFRACAEDTDDSIESGVIRSFVTDDEGGNNNPSTPDEDPRAVTNIASGITTSSARLNSIVIGEGDAVCYFQYGRTQSFGLTSPRTAVDLDQSGSCSSTRTGLASNSTYYYRAVVEQNGVRYYGSTRSFNTNRVTTTVNPRPNTPVTPSNPTPNGTNTTITIVNQNETVVASEELDLMKWVSAENDPRFDTETEARPGETVYYKVRVTNDTDTDLDNIVVIDRIPFYLELDESESLNDDDDKQLRWVIDLEEGESRTFITEMRVREDARDGDIIESYASAETEEYSVNSNDVLIQVEESRNTVTDTDEDPNQSGFAFGSGIFPTDVTGWGLLLLIVLAIAYFFSRIMVSRNENEKVLAELHAAKAARTNA